MKIYFTYNASYKELLKETGVRLLYTYPGVNKALPEWWLPDASDIIIDSGGYQVANGTNRFPLLIEAYISWLKKVLHRYGDRVSFYMNLDTNEEATTANYNKMVDEGLSPVPIWKDGWKPDKLKECCSQSELVAIGGLVGKKKQPFIYYYDLYQYIQSEFPFNRFHMLGLGVTLSTFRQNKPYSIDFSNWCNPPRVAHYIEFTPTRLKETPLDEEMADRIRFDKKCLYKCLKQNIRTLQSLEETDGL